MQKPCGIQCARTGKDYLIARVTQVEDPLTTLSSGEVDKPASEAKTLSLGQPFFKLLSFSRIRQAGFSIVDQAFFVGGTFLANVMLARTQTKEEYGMFALSYSAFTFLTGLHNAAILEPYTVYASGRYRNYLSQYLRLMAASNAIVGLTLMAILLLLSLFFFWFAPSLYSRSLVGLGVTIGFLFSGIFLRRAFYVQGNSAYAAFSSLTFFATAAVMTFASMKAHALNGFSIFLVLAFGWLIAGLVFARRLPCWRAQASFLRVEPHYWREHWNYSRWVLITACVFQLTTQGYYWLVAAFLSVKDVAELRAMYLLIAPVDQIFIALSFLLLPMFSSRYAMRKIPEFLSLWRKYTLATVGLTALFALAVWALGRPALHLVYAGKFDNVVLLLFRLALLPFLMGIGNTVTVALSALEKPKLVFFGFLSSGVATFALGVPLVLRMGLRGAVYGMLLSAATYSAALTVAFFFNLPGRTLQGPDHLGSEDVVGATAV